MALYVNTNVSSINAQRKLANSTLALNTSYQRLSSGLRINSSKDDAAGLQISDRLTSQINGLNQGNRNANDGIALAQTIVGALDEQTNMLQRIRTLAVQAANGTNTEKDRKALQEEVTSLSHEITRIAKKSTFAGALILDGAGDNSLTRKVAVGGAGANTFKGQYFFQVGANSMDEITMDTRGFKISNALSAMSATKWTVNGQQINNDFSKAGVICKEKGANNAIYSNARFSVSTASMAQITLANIDKFIEYVDSNRAELGAIQNRMESTIRNQSSIAENESDARSRIRDTDFASETAALTQNQIIQQASQSILSQANQRPTVALSLLGGR